MQNTHLVLGIESGRYTHENAKTDLVTLFDYAAVQCGRLHLKSGK